MRLARTSNLSQIRQSAGSKTLAKALLISAIQPPGAASCSAAPFRACHCFAIQAEIYAALAE
jgi:hypothetical protein